MNTFNTKGRIPATDIAKLAVLAIILGVMLFFTTVNPVPGHGEIVSTSASMRGEVLYNASRGHDYLKDQFLLDGEWEFYPNQLLYPEDFANAPAAVSYVKFPHYWKDDPGNFPDGTGYATYRMIFNTPPGITDLGVRAPAQHGAYRLFLNGHKVAEAGNVSENIDEHYFAMLGKTGFVSQIDTTRYEIIIQIQGYNHLNSGLTETIIVGSHEAINKYHDALVVLTGMFVGLCMLLIYYFLLLYILNPDKKKYLNFALVSLCCLYTVLTFCGDNAAYLLAPTISPTLIYKLQFIAFIMSSYFATAHIVHPHFRFKNAASLGRGYPVGYCVFIALLTPYQISSMATVLTLFATLYVFVATGICFTNLLKSKALRSRYATTEFIALAALIIGTVVNRLGFTPIYGFNFMPSAMLLFCFIQIYVLSEFYKSNEKDLVKVTKQLEKRVSERTAALADSHRRIQSANDFKAEFLARMSRELRTPMNAIVGMSDLFDTGSLNETQKGYFRDIRESSYSLLGLINDIMDFSKIEADRLELAQNHFKFDSFFENICSAANYAATKKDLKFEYTKGEGIPDVILSDEGRMKQVIANIISNAVKYTLEGSIKLEVRATGKPENPESMLLFTISDTGVGIDKEALPRLFSAFTNPDSIKPQHRMIAGTGLGMSICKKLTDALGGKLEAASELGKGSVFKAYFPLNKGDPAQVTEGTATEKIFAHNARVLLVEDNSINVTIALGILAAHDIAPDIAKDGYRALEMVKEKDYDLIFMDQFMPGMDGIEATVKIREMGGKYAEVPIVAMTSNITVGARDMMIFKGMNDYLAKPVDRNALNNVLIKWLPHGKITSAMGNFVTAKETLLEGLPHELVAITDLNCSDALKNMKGNLSIYTKLLNQLAAETEGYIQSLDEYLGKGDGYNYRIVINGLKNLLYSVGAKSCGDSAAQLEKAAEDGDLDFCTGKHKDFAESLNWLSQRIGLAMPGQK
ncbi:MAG: ATP-binding protein [Oscillospiraceae bacterium]|nr:ATP-binding protein [Oscillospiraceae bacterium]